jgi:hypothetical protein
VAGIRLLRHLAATALPAGTLRYLNRTTACALVASLVGAASVISVHPLAGVLVAGACAVALVIVAGAFRRLTALAALADEPAPDDALQDIRALILRLPELGFDPRRHQWRFAAIVALGAGVVAAAGHAFLDDGGSLMIGPSALAAGAVIVAIEGGAVLASYAALGRFLGLVQRPR